ncbi:MAG: serine hydrolase, partial [Bacteroidota bacterium]
SKDVYTSLLASFSQMNNGAYDHIHSLLIVKQNKLVLEEYFHGYQREDLKDIRSAFKSISAMLVGKAVDEGYLSGVTVPLLDFYPSYDTIQGTAKRLITVGHALTMTTGIELEDEDEMQWNHPDWVGYKLSLPMVAMPGEAYTYSSGGMNLLSGVISHSTQEYLPHYLYSGLLLPMGIEDFQMLTSPYGRGYLAGNVFLRPVDFIKFGVLVLNEGEWNGKQVLSKSWIAEMTSPKVSIAYPKDSDYGYLWRILQREIQGKKYETIEAWGNGGQFLIVIPELEMCISFTGGNYNLFPQMEKGPFEILEKYIFPSLQL